MDTRKSMMMRKKAGIKEVDDRRDGKKRRKEEGLRSEETEG